MDLKIVKYIFLSLCALAVLFYIAARHFNIDVLSYIALALLFISGLFFLIFGRCPCCGGSLARNPGKYCQHCGEKLDW